VLITLFFKCSPLKKKKKKEITVMGHIPAIFSFQWFSSYDEEGRVYFFEENSNESTWTLPDDGSAGCDVSTAEGVNKLL
jgi:hypothetical protein